MMKFKNATKRHAILANHETPMSVLALLGDESPRYWEEKDLLVRALIRERQRDSSPFWNTLLTIAFYPMLARLRGRLQSEAITKDDMDQLVVTTFLEVVSEFSLDDNRDRTCMYLRQLTQRLVFRKLRSEQAEQTSVRSARASELEKREEELVDLADPETLAAGQHLRWPDTKPEKNPSLDNQEETRLITFLVDRVGDDIDGENLALVIATQVRGERLSNYVERTNPGLSPQDQKRTYQRIKRRHSRALAKLRELLSDLRCPQNDPSSALPLRSDFRFEGGEFQ